MRLSVVSEHKPLEIYLRQYDSITLVNYYSNLQTEYDAFSNDLNKVDVFAIVEYSDLSGNLTAISKLVQSGDGYLLGAKEILVVLNANSERTLNRSDKISAFSEILEEKNYNVRIETPIVLDFTSIYNALINNTVIKESTIKIYDKYKVSKTDKGIIVKPKKTQEQFSPDTKTGNKQALKKIDKNTGDMLGDTLLEIPDREDMIERTVDNILELPSLSRLTHHVVFITGVTDSGKTHSMLTFLDELNKNRISALAVDSTGSDDMRFISSGNNFQAPVLKGTDLFTTKEQGSMGVCLYRKAYTSTFIHQLDNIAKTKNIIFCEVGLDQLTSFESTWDGDVSIIVVVKFDVTSLLELKEKLTPNIAYKVYINNDQKDIIDISEEKILRQFLGDNIQIFNYSTRLDLFNSLGGT